MVMALFQHSLAKSIFSARITTLQFARLLGTTSTVLKRKKNDPVKQSSNHLKKQAPFVFKAAKNSIPKANLKNKVYGEVPLLFQAVKVSPDTVEDSDHTDVYNELKIHAAKKETAFVIQPNYKWGKERFRTKLVENRLAEAEALLDSVHSWKVHSSCIESVHDINPKMFFGSGKVLELSEKIRNLINDGGVTMVFLNTERLTLHQIKELEAAWGCKVFDRYRVVLELFKERAKTQEAKLQVQLAEIHYLRTHISSEDMQGHDQQRGGKGRFGSGETYMEKTKRVLADAENKIKNSLTHIKKQRSQAKAERIKKRIPQVAMVGYTNAGKTTLAKALSFDKDMEPEDRLFATLDTTAHRGKLPSGLNLVYIDTVGFITDLPHDLVESFATTLDDVKTADVLIHVSDCSHPEYNLQKETVEDVLSKLDVPIKLKNNMIHVLNKVDLRDRGDSLENNEAYDSHSLEVSAVNGTGIEELRHLIEKKVLESTGRETVRINIDQQGDELSWLYRLGTVTDTIAHDDGSLDVIAILDEANQKRFEKHFHVKLKR